MSVVRFGSDAPWEAVVGYSRVVVHGDMAWVSGTTATVDGAVVHPGDAGAQTRQALALVDSRLAEAGSHKSRILIAQVLVSDMRHFAGMNAAWDAWVDQDHPPCRFCCEARLGHPDLKVEIVIQAAV